MERKWIRTAALFVLPALLLFITFTYYPFIRSLYYSFTTWDSIRKPVFIGLDNYTFLFEDRKMIAAAMNTFKMALFGLFIQNPLAIWIAVLLNRKFATGYFLRAAVFFPVIISLVVLSVVWSQILSYEGTLNLVLNQLGLSGWIRDWLGETKTVFVTIILLTQWQGLGYCVIFYLAGLQSIPADLYEASRIDGAGAIQRFLKITFPLLMPTITIVTFLIIVGGLKLFDIPYILTSGGPGTASYTLALAIYNAAFRENNAGYSIAAGVVLMLIIMVITFIQLQITRRREVEM
ncbi:carbohydrate ABC transporter permease [Paenibacillus sp. PAMC21692]|uniref:carbohydrate ABC transporter permease n=1 Tax=Paenibacillus sp. PAMC21692 TaxID=2762320 RepID=UPI00164D775F|nr:sugar ABC transporter permease [Paenibacillus sp. PAMC21692]QNK56144.1 sugar ABC transporter permease [Paenibacillus sp. PAMC21692]